MRVELVQAPTDAAELITDIASICYGKDQASHPDKLLKHLFEGGHHSVFEHVNFTFKIEGISRTCLAQLTRHRHASYTVRSQRYCNEEEQGFVIPDEIKNSNGILAYEDMIGDIKLLYSYLISIGIKKEDARFILPEAATTELFMSMNLRSILNLHKLRSHKSAQWEIRNLTKSIVNLVVSTNPELEFMFE